MNNPSKLLKIGQASKVLGVSIDTLRRWEKAGKIQSIRTPGGTRLYSIEHLQQVNPNASVQLHQTTSAISTEELLKKTEKETSSYVIASEAKQSSFDNEIATSPTAPRNDSFKKSFVTKFLIGSTALAVFTLLVTSWITLSYLSNPKDTQRFFKSNIASGVLKPFHALSEAAVAVISPNQAQELGFIPPDIAPPPILGEQIEKQHTVLGTTSASRFLEVNSDTQINGSLYVRDSINDIILEGTPSANTINLTSGNTSLTITNSSTIDQDLSSVSSPTFSSVNAGTIALSAASSQISSGSFSYTLPGNTTTLVGTDTTQTLTNKSMSGSANTFTNIPNSALVNKKVTVTAGTNLTGGGDVELGGSITISAKSSPSFSGVVLISDGTAAAPGLAFTDDTDTGLYRIGTNNIALITAGSATNGLSIDANGNVGIGTITPTSKLHVVGTANVTSNATIGGTLGVTGATTLTGAATLSSTLGVTGATTLSSTLNVSGNSTFGTNTLFIDTANGNVGIGTTSPAAPLHVWGNGSTSSLFLNGNVGINTSAPSRQFQVNSGSGSFVVSSNGSVGIGTTNPSGWLHVYADSSVNNQPPLFERVTSSVFNNSEASTLDLLHTTSGSMTTNFGTILRFYGKDDDGVNNLFGFIGARRDGADNTGRLIFTVVNGGTASEDVMIIDPNGNVGIGVTTPISKLGVGGNVGIGSIFGWKTVPTNGLAVEGNVGIGTTTANSTLSVAGSAHIGGTYQGIAAPTNGLFVDGNVGIGATTSANKLDVWGNARITGTLTLDGNITALGSGVFLAPDGSAASPSFSFNSDLDTGLFRPGNNTLGFATNGSTRMSLNDTGLGIGITAPASGLAVSTNALIGYSDGVNAPASGLAVSGNVGIGITTANSALTVNGGAVIGSGFNVVAPSNGLLVQGNVGIGTTTPGSTLQLNGNAVIGFSTTNIAGPSSGLAVAGNVGIGTSSPNNTLQVVGLINFDDSINGTFVGTHTGPYNTGSYNSAFGYDSLYFNTTGESNSAFGEEALTINTIGSNNSAFGKAALTNNISGSKNSAFGENALGNSDGSNNSAFGYNALTSNTTGSSNSAFGYQALTTLGVGTSNAAFGYNSGLNVTGSANTLIGTLAGQSLTTGSGNIVLGYNADALSATGSNNLNIGNLLFGTGLGSGTSIAGGNIGIGTSVPGSKLGIAGNVGIGVSFANTVIPSNGLAVSGNVGIGTTTANNNLSVVGGVNISNNYQSIIAPTSGLFVEGNVGIGATTSNNKLDVWGNSRFAGNLTVDRNVGIGTTTPGVTLDVSGAVRTNNNFYVNGGTSNLTSLNEIVNINKTLGPNASGSWSTGTAGGTARRSASTALYNGKMYSWAGFTSANVNTLDIYDIASNSWSTGTAGGTARRLQTSTLYNGKIYSWGGFASAATNTLDIYDIATDSWSTGTAGGTARFSHSATLYNGKIYFWGGSTGSVVNTLDIYDIATDSWSTGTAGGTARRDHESVIYNGKIYSWGGTNSGGSYLNTVDIYDIATDSWSTGTAGGTARTEMALVPYNGKIYIWGGTNGSVLNTVDIYDIASNSWSTGTAGGTARRLHVSTLYNGKIYSWGGLNSSDTNINTLDIYDIGFKQNILALQENGQDVLSFQTGSQLFLGSGRFGIMGGNVGIGTSSPTSQLQINSGANGLFFSSAGNLGLGATTSSNKLDVWGNTRITGTLTVDGSTTLNGAQFLASNGSASAPSFSFTNSTSTGLWSPSANALSLTTNGSGTSGLTITAGGNVGIGITSPSQAFQVNSGSSSTVITSTGNVGIGTTSPLAPLQVQGNGTNSAFFLNGNVGIGNTFPGGLLHVGSSATAPSLFVTSGGNVGIGTTAIGMSGLYVTIDDPANWAGIFYNSRASGDPQGLLVTTSQNTGNGAKFQVGTGTPGSLQSVHFMVNNAGNIGVGLTTANSQLSISNNVHIGSLYQGIPAPTDGLFVDGNVGIGATTSSNKLDVWGNARITGTLTVDSTLSSSGVFRASNGSATTPAYSFTNLTNAGLWTNGDGLLLTTGGSNTSGITVTAAGNVGIGITNPVQALSIQTSDDPTIRLRDSGADKIVYIGNVDSRIYLASDQGTTGRKFSIDVSAPDDAMFVNLSGNLGIGITSAPDRLLHVASTINITSSNAGLLGVGGTQFGISGATTNAAKKLVLGLDTTDNYGVIQAGNTDGTNYTLALNPAGGNVGIGTTSPAALLTVGNGNLFQVNSNGSTTITQAAVSGGQTTLSITPGAHTAVTAESSAINIPAHTLSMSTPGLTQRTVNIETATYIGNDVGTGTGLQVAQPTTGEFPRFITNISAIRIPIGVSRAGHTASQTVDGIHIAAGTVTFRGGNTYTTNPVVTGMRVEQITINQADSGVETLPSVASLYIAGAMAAGPGVTLTNNYAFWVDDGLSRFDGNVGIGATTSSNKLDVWGNARITGTLTVDGAVTSSSSQYLASDGSASSPSFSFVNDTNTGIFRPGTDALGLTTGGTSRLTITANGNLGIGLTNPQSFMTVGPIYLADTFTRSNSDTLGATDTGNIPWTEESGDIDIVSNKAAYATADGNATVETYSADVDITAELARGSIGTSGIVWRLQDASNYYRIDVGTQLEVYKVVGGSSTSLKQVLGGGLSNGTSGTFRIRHVGSELQVYRNGVQLVAITDSTFTTPTKHGFYTTGCDTACTIDNVKIVPLSSRVGNNQSFSNINVGIGTSDPSSLAYGQYIRVMNSATHTPNTVYGQYISFIDPTALANNLYGLFVDMSNSNTSSYKTAAVFTGGNVGIGTSVPNATLSIQGNVGIGYTGVNQSIPVNGLAVSGNVGIGATTANSNLFVNGGTAIGSGFNFTAPTNGLLVQGNVGIGFSSPTALLTLASSSDPAINIHNDTGFLKLVGGSAGSATGASIVMYGRGTTGNSVGGSLAQGAFHIGTPRADLAAELTRFEITGNATTANAYFLNSNVGIGTTTPGTTFAVVGNSTIGYGSSAVTPAGPSSGLAVSGNVGIGTTTTLATLDVRGSAVFNNNQTDSNFRVAGTTNSNLFFIDANGLNQGAIGIGTGTPAALLDVVATDALGGPVAKFNAAALFGGTTYGLVEMNGYDNDQLTTALKIYDENNNVDLLLQSLGDGGTNSQLYFRGNLGIGFTSPDRKIQGASDINITSTNASLLGAAGSQFSITGSTATTLTKKLVLGLDTTDNYGVIQAGNTSGTNYDLALNPAGGNVGIGITTPSGIFQVNTPTKTGLIYKNDGSTKTGLFVNNTLVIGDPSVEGDQGIGIDSRRYTMLLNRTWTAELVNAASIRIDDSITAGNNLGIYTVRVNPNWATHTSGTHPLFAGYFVDSPTITNNGATVTDATSLYIEDAPGGVTTNPTTAIWVNSGNVKFDQGVFMALENNSNVGIGASLPQAKLSIQGNVGIGYTGINQSIPVNGLAVSGNVGIGTTTANSALTVIGGATIGGAYNVTAPTNGLIVQGNVGIGTTATGATALDVAGNLSLGTGNRASSGTIRLPNASEIRWRNAANTADLRFLTNSSDQVFIDDGTNTRFLVSTTIDQVVVGSGSTSGYNTGLGIVPIRTGLTANSYGSNIEPNLTTANSSSISLIASLGISEPNITLGSGASVTEAASLYIDAAPTEATRNYALFVNNGLSRFDGNVGIGATTSTNLLDVWGNARITGTLTVDGAVTSSSSQYLASDGSASSPSYSFTNDTDTGLWRPTTNIVALTTNGAGALQTGSTINGMVVNASGFVGIGTTTPSLAVGSAGLSIISSAAELNLASNATGGRNISLISTTGPAGLLLRDNTAGGYIHQLADSGGNMGIGTALQTLSSKLAVAGNAGIGVSFATAITPLNGLAVEGNLGIGTTSPQTKLQVWGDNTNSAFFLNGNVGIGNTTPAAALEITGNLLFSKETARTISVANTTTANTAGGALSIGAANGNGSGNGGALALTSGTGGSTGAGGAITLTAGTGGSSSGAAGTITITGGAAGVGSVAGGNVSIQGGAAFSNTAASGDIVLGNVARTNGVRAGNISIIGDNAGTNASSNGGAITIRGGVSGPQAAGATGGALTLAGGAAASSTDHVGGAISITGGAGAPTSGTGAGGAITITSGAGGGTSGASGDLTLATGITVSGNTGALTLRTGAATGGNAGGILFQTNGTNSRMAITPAGNVGIGLTNPTSLLQVSSTAAQDLFRVDDNGDGDTSPFVINLDGNVGIANSAPSYTLDVVGNTRISSHLQLNGYTHLGTGAAGFGPGSGGSISQVVMELQHDMAASGGGHAIGIYSNPTRTVATSAGIFHAAFTGNAAVNAAATISNTMAYWAGNSTVAGGATITNNYGLYVENMTSGTNDFGVYVVGADSAAGYFGGNVGIGFTSPSASLHILNTGAGNSFRVDDVAEDTTPFIIDASGNVGIGTSATSELTLNVLGFAGSGAGSGGGISLISGAGGSSSGKGGDILIQVGTHTNTTNRGVLSLKGGSATDLDTGGGPINITGGDGRRTSTAGAVNITGGTGLAAGPTVGGAINIIGGDGTTTGAGGSVFVAGGTSASGTAGDVLLAVNSASTIRGNVGIGTTGPGALFHIQANTTKGTADIGSDATAEQISRFDVNIASGTRNGILQILGTNTPANHSIAFHSASAASSGLAFSTRNSAGTGAIKMVINGEGNLGIGFTSPSALTHIVQTAAANAFRVDDIAEDTTPFIIDASGNTLIGVESSTIKLHVRGSPLASQGNAKTQVLIQDDTSMAVGVGGGLLLGGQFNSGAYASFGGIWTEKANGTGGNRAANLAFGTNDGVDGDNFVNTRMLITAAGNVGIGSTTAVTKLAVGGNVAIGANYGWLAAPSNGLAVEGNVGIGTTSPLTSLHIVTTGEQGGVRIEGPTLANLGLNIINGTAGGRRYDIYSTGGGSGAGNGRLAFYDFTESAYRMVIDPNGNVGIGTATPLSKLAVTGNVGIGVSFGTAVSPVNGLAIEGNVGIGTTTTNAKLDITGGGSTVRINPDGTTIAAHPQTNVLTVIRNAATDGIRYTQHNVGAIWMGHSTVGVIGVDSAAIAFKTGISGTTGDTSGGSTRMTITSSGNLGIGVTNPAGALHVNGAAGIGYGSLPTSSFPSNGLAVSGNVGIGTTTTVSPLHIWGNGTAAATFLNGNVGIGFTTTSANLTVASQSVTSGKLVDINTLSSNTLTTGTLLNVSSAATSLTGAAGTGSLLHLAWAPPTSTTATGDLFALSIGANGTTTGNLFNILDGGSSIFSVSETSVTTSLPTNFTSSGDVAIAYDLNFTNPTASYIKSAAPLYIQAGESFNSSDLTLRTFNSGNIQLDTGLAGNVGIGVSGNTNFLFTNAGNLGIGITVANPTAQLQVRGNATFGYAGGTIGPANGLAVSGNVGIGNTTANSTLVLNQGSIGVVGASNTHILDLKSSTVFHGVTNRAETNTYGFLGEANAAGGIFIEGIVTQGTATPALEFHMGATGDTTKSASGRGMFEIDSYLSAPGGGGQTTANANIFALRENSVTRLIINDEGSIYMYPSTFPATNTGSLISSNSTSYLMGGNVGIGATAMNVKLAVQGNVGIGTSTGDTNATLTVVNPSIGGLPTSAATVIAVGSSDGTTAGTSIRAKGLVSAQQADFGEYFPFIGEKDEYQVGDLVANLTGEAVSKTDTPYQNGIRGIITTASAFAAGDDAETQYDAAGHPTNRVAVALLGRVKLKVSTENGPIQIGDFLTSSSIPGVAMKASKPGFVVGKALENYSQSDPTIVGKVLTFVSAGYADPNNFLASLSLDSDGNLIAPKIKTDKLLVSGNIGLGTTDPSSLLSYELTPVAENTSKVGLDSFEVSVNVMASLKNLDQAVLDVASKQASDSANIAGIQSDIASASAQIAENKSQTLTLAEQLASAAAELASTKSKVDSLNLTPPDTLLASGSGTLTTLQVSEATVSGMLVAYQAEIQDNFKVFGGTTLAKTAINGDLTVDGTLSIENGSELNVIGTLFLQKNLLAEKLDIFNGKVTIDNSGNILTQGTVTASEIKTNKLKIVDSHPELVSGSTASASATLAATIGTATLPAATTKVTISTTEATSSAKVFITPTTPTDKVLSVTNIKNKESFDVSTLTPATSDIDFNWWIVGTQ